MKKMILFILIIVWSILGTGCSYMMSLSTVKNDMDKDWYKTQIQPIREVKVLILANEPDPGLEYTIKEVSDEMIKQVGISLNVIGYAPITKKFSGGTRGALQTLRVAAEEPKIKYDMAITTWGVMGMDVMAPLGFFMLGVIDDTYRRYVVVRVKSKFILLHEVYHAFIFEHAHGQCVMMSGLWPIGSSCYWLEKENWDEVLKNKWRNFTDIPDIDEENRPDKITAGKEDIERMESIQRAIRQTDKLHLEYPWLKDWKMPWQFDPSWEEGMPLPKAYLDQVRNCSDCATTNPGLAGLKEIAEEGKK